MYNDVYIKELRETVWRESGYGGHDPQEPERGPAPARKKSPSRIASVGSKLRRTVAG